MLCHDSPCTKQRRLSLILFGRNNGFCSQIYMHIGQSSARVLELALGLWWSGLVYYVPPSSSPWGGIIIRIPSIFRQSFTSWYTPWKCTALPVGGKRAGSISFLSDETICSYFMWRIPNWQLAALGNGIQNPEKILRCTHQFLQV